MIDRGRPGAARVPARRARGASAWTEREIMRLSRSAKTRTWCGRLAATAVLSAVIASSSAAASAHARPKLHDGVGGFKVRPATILVSGDGSGWLGGDGFGDPGDYGKIHWTRFRRSGARGDGRMFINDCVPDCAGGTVSNWAAVIRASRVRKARFTRLSARYERDGATVTDRWKLHVSSPSYAYWFAIAAQSSPGG
jgi:hypothetical protein